MNWDNNGFLAFLGRLFFVPDEYNEFIDYYQKNQTAKDCRNNPRRGRPAEFCETYKHKNLFKGELYPKYKALQKQLEPFINKIQ